MSEPAKVRLVRCPKCENLLPELPDYSVYECGGCGAVLRGKRTTGDVDALSVKSDEERSGGVLERSSEKSGNIDLSEKRMSNLTDVSDNDVRSNGSSVNRADRRRFMPDTIENYGTSSSAKAGLRFIEDVREMDKNLNGMSRTKMEREFQNMKPQRGNVILGLQRSGDVPNWTIGERSEMEGFQRVQRIDGVGMSYSASNYTEEGPSNYQSRGYAEPLDKRNEMNGFEEVRYFGEDRVDLLRKLDELRDQLSRSSEVVNNPKNKVPLDRRMVPQYPYNTAEKWFPEGYSATQYSFPGKHPARPPYVDQYAEISPFVDRHAMAGYGFYPPTHTSGHVHEFEDASRPQMLRRGPKQPSAAFQQKQSQHTHFGQYMDRNMNQMDLREPYPPSINLHHTSCSCLHCYSKYQVPPNAYGDRQFSDGSEDLSFYRRENPNEFGPRDYSERISDLPSFASHNSRLQSQFPSDLSSEVSGFAQSRPSKVLLANSGRRCRPIAGGAPFLSCQNCYELLELPKKVLSNSKNQMKIRCGGCSALIVLVVDIKGLNISSCVEANQIDGKNDLSHTNRLNEGSSYGPVHPIQASAKFSSEDYDNSGYNFQSMDRELGPLSAGWGSSNKSRDVRSSRSTYTSTSEEEESLEKFPAIRKESNSSELLVKGKVSPPPAGSPLQEYFDYSNKYNVTNRFGEENKSGVSEQDKARPKKTISRKNSIEDTSATEIEISSNEYSNTGTSLDSGEASKDGNQLRANKAAEFFFAGIMKKSFRDLNKSNNCTDQEYANVTVNGNLIPDRFIKRAEKIAGPIHPGNYWYDFRAGFWGVMGGPCLGIIPPFIEEFNYPMPENCTGGKTGALVNGRELHEKDLILLGSRGLPTERDRSYILEVSGRVLDEHTGEELESIGKLAPTVERLKRGFGMKVPKAMA